MKRILLSFFGVLFASFLFVSFVKPAQAWEIRKGETVVLGPKESFKESLVVTGGNLNIDSQVDGDLYCAGKKVVINGNISGDILCAAQQIDIKGKVGGSIRVAAQMIDLEGQVMKNATLFAQDITLGNPTVINGDLYTASSNIVFNGKVMKSWAAHAEMIDLNGVVVGNTNLVVNKLSLGKSAVLQSKLNYTSQQDAQVTAGSKLAQGFNRLTPTTKAALDTQKKFWVMPTTAVKGLDVAGKVMGAIWGLIVGAVIVLIFPKWVAKSSALIWDKTGKSALWGLLVWAVAPVLIVMSVITIIGIPLAFFMGLALFVVAGLAHIVAATAIGHRIITDKKQKLIWVWLVGFLILTVISWLPVVGWLVSLLVLLIGTGAVKRSFLEKKKA